MWGKIVVWGRFFGMDVRANVKIGENKIKKFSNSCKNTITIFLTPSSSTAQGKGKQ